jgi:hypothetical protein
MNVPIPHTIATTMLHVQTQLDHLHVLVKMASQEMVWTVQVGQKFQFYSTFSII